jgi:cell migration-inducing and hyaluronan-binding protein
VVYLHRASETLEARRCRAAAPQQPITLGRNGKDFNFTANQSTVRAGTEIRVKTERPEVSISLAKDSRVVFEFPGFANATSGG